MYVHVLWGAERDYTISNFIVVLVTRALTGGRVAGYMYIYIQHFLHVMSGARVRNARVSDAGIMAGSGLSSSGIKY